jgi:hypothetical protein
MDRAKGQAYTFPEFPKVSASWDNMNGRYIVKKTGVKLPPFFVAPRNHRWTIQSNPSLVAVGEPYDDRSDAIKEAVKLTYQKS